MRPGPLKAVFAFGAALVAAGTPAPGTLRTQTPVGVPPASAPAAAPPITVQPDEGSNLTIYLLTFGHGDLVWEKFGHNAIWVHDATAGTDVTYNWGMFDFNQPHFIRRFLSGNTQYWMDTIPLSAIMQEYRARNRTVLAQELNLTAAQKIDLERFLEWNAMPQNQFYRYDYFRDNCSTRLRDALDRAVNGQIRRATDTVRTATTYRWHTARLMADNIPIYTGIMLALGHRADKPITAWEEMFLPVPMSARLRAVNIAGPDSTRIPLVRAERQLLGADRAPERETPPNYLPLFVAVGLVTAALILYLVRAGESGSRAAAVFAGLLAGLWSLLSGFFGLVVVAAWLLTAHVFMGMNENLLQFNPLSFILAIMIPFGIGIGRLTRGLSRLATLIAMLSLLGFIMQGLPAWNQPNGEIIALALPLNLATAWAVYRLSHYKRISRSSSAER